MKVGDYVRSDKGEIGKITTIAPKDALGLGDEYNDLVAYNTEPFVVGNIIKSSPNIIDLIEEGDYVNGENVEDFDNELGIPMYDEGDYFMRSVIAYTPLSEIQIKSIVTKEQFKTMEYRIGDD